MCKWLFVSRIRETELTQNTTTGDLSPLSFCKQAILSSVDRRVKVKHPDSESRDDFHAVPKEETIAQLQRYCVLANVWSKTTAQNKNKIIARWRSPLRDRESLGSVICLSEKTSRSAIMRDT